MNIRKKLRQNKINNYIKKREWKKLFDYIQSNKHLIFEHIENLDEVIDSVIEDEQIKVFFNSQFYYVYNKNDKTRKDFFEKIIKKSSIKLLENNMFNDVLFFYTLFKENKINDVIEKEFKHLLTYDNKNIIHDYITTDFYKYVMLLIGDYDYYNQYGYLLEKEKLKEFFTLENLDLMRSNNWNDIIVDFAIEDGDIFKFIKSFSKSPEVYKLINILDKEIDCKNIENYEFIVSFSKCNSAKATASILKYTNLSIEEQKKIINEIPKKCEFRNPLSWSDNIIRY